MKLYNNQKEMLEKYLSMRLNLHHFMNRHAELVNVLKSKQITDKLFELTQRKFKDNFLPVSFALSSWDVKEATKIFGKGIKVKDLGEGIAKSWFFEIQNKIVLLFVDSRGMAIEIEGEIKDYESILTELILEMLDKPNANFKNYCKQNRIE